MSIVLLSAAALLGKSLRNLEHQNFGFAAEGRYLVYPVTFCFRTKTVAVDGKNVPPQLPYPLATVLSLSATLSFLSSRGAADSLRRVGREMTKLVPSAISKGEIEGCPRSRF